MPNNYIVDTNNVDGLGEIVRLQLQDDILSQQIPTFPEGFSPCGGKCIIDLACGPGSQVLRMAKELQNSRIVAVDIDTRMIAYANAQAQTEKKHVEFHVFDITKPMPFLENDFFDLVNMRFAMGALNKEHWPLVIEECYRITKPGGMIYLTEADLGSIPGAPILHRMQQWIYHGLFLAGKGFSQTEVALGPMLQYYVQRVGYKDIVCRLFPLDISANAPLHKPTIDNFKQSNRNLQRFMMKTNNLSEEEFEEIYRGVNAEMDSDNFLGWWCVATVSGRKPEER